MKKILLILLGVLLALPAFAQSFDYTYEGQTLTYTIIDKEAKTVSVKSPNDDISGEVILPSNPKHRDVVYTLTEIDNEAFRSCYKLTSVTIPNTVTSIGNEAFNGCGLISVTIPSSVTQIGRDAFAYCYYLDSVILPDAITSISECCFEVCISLKSVEIPNSVTTIGLLAFYGCSSLASVTIPNSVTSIGSSAFDSCVKLSSITIPSSVTTIESGAFRSTGITTLEIPNSVTEIGYGAFAYCQSLESVTIPASVSAMGNEVFAGCPSLSSVYYNTENPVVAGFDIFDNKTYDDATLYVPESAIGTFKKTDPWSYFYKIQAYNFSSGIEGVSSDAEAKPCEYFSIGGVKAGDSRDDLTPGVYIERQGNATKKIVVK